MGEVPLDARRVVEELRAARRKAASSAPRSWLPSDSFESTLSSTLRPPAHLNEHLQWLHHSWDLRALLAPRPARGMKGLARRLAHRAVMAVLGPYLDRLQDYLGVNVRAIDTIAKRVDDATIAQQRLLGAVRADLVDFARHVDERLDG